MKTTTLPLLEMTGEKQQNIHDLPAKSTRLIVDCIDVFSFRLFCTKFTVTIVCARLNKTVRNTFCRPHTKTV